MGSFDCYCALCAGPLNIGVMKFGSRRPKALEKRRRRVAAEDTEDDDEDEEMEDADKKVSDEDDKAPVLPNPFAKQEEPSWGDDIESDLDFEADEENPAFSSDSESLSDSDPDLFLGDITDVSHRPLTPDPRTLRDPDCWSQWSDLSIYEGFNPYDTNGEDSYRETNSYDPYKLQADDVRWIDRCRCLAFNPNAPGVTKAYISGRGRYNDYGSFDVRRPGSDPNDDHDRSHTCFFAFSPDESSSFPFHEECYRILAKALEHKRYQDIDKDVLYGVMAAHTSEYGSALDISYGGISGGEQFWTCISGEEYAVCDPGLRIGLEDVLQGMLPARLFDGNLHFPDLSHKPRHDPLSVMPYDVLLNIFKHVCTNDMLALMNASTHVSETTRNRSFWKHMLHLRILPWFWELSTLLENTTLTETFNYKGLFVWINRITTPKYGMEGPLMGIANRRRIWESCKAIAPEYRKQLPSAPRSGPEEDEARAILDRAESFHMPLVLYPSPKGATTVSAQFVRSWHEIAHRSCELDTYWNDDSALVGIAVTFGTEQRLFGSTAGERGASLHIEACEWIQEVRVLLNECNMFDESVDRRHYHSALNSRAQGNSQIEGMEVILTSGRTEVIKTGGRNTRTFVVLKDMYLIGLTGQIAPNGVISRLGFLQSYHPEHNPRAPRLSYNPAQTTLWDQSALHLPPGPESQLHVPIWASSFYHLHTFTSGPRYDSGDLPLDVLPHHVLLWSKTAETNKDLRGISAFVIEAGHVISGPDRWPIPDLLGFAAWHQAPHQDDTKPAIQHVSQRVGTFNPVPAQSEEWNKCGYGVKRLDDNGNPLPPLNPSELDLGSKFQQFDTRFTQNFPIDGVNGECIQQIDVSTDFKAIKLITNQGRECYWGEQRRGQWYSRVASDEEFIAGLSVGFGKLGGWSWGAKMYSHWKVSEIGVIMRRRDGEKWV